MQSVEEELHKFGKHIVKESRTNLTKKGNNDTKKLYNSIGYNVKVSKNSIQLDYFLEDYGKFKDAGVRGKNSSAKAPNSPFRFGTGTGKKGGLTNAINGWVERKRFQFRNKKTGIFLSYKSTAFLITRSIYQKGISPTNFYSKPFESAFKRLPEKIIKAYGLDLEEQLKKALI